MNVVIKVDEETKQKMIEYYKDKVRDKVIPYAIFQAQEEDTTITMYESGKVMFQGTSADVDASMWQNINKNSEETKDTNYYYTNSIGSDEVGTGDYFGPIVVTATFVKKEDIPYLESLKVGDSKEINDDIIKKIAPLIAQKIPYKSIILSNEEYNEKYGNDLNINKIKAIMHNKVLLSLKQEIKDYDLIIVDQFAKEQSYYNYLNDVKEVVNNITFVTHAENKNLAVASASIISRYIFLNYMDKLSDKLHMVVPKGASHLVDDFGRRLVEKKGEEILKKIAKYNFQNTKKILKTFI